MHNTHTYLTCEGGHVRTCYACMHMYVIPTYISCEGPPLSLFAIAHVLSMAVHTLQYMTWHSVTVLYMISLLYPFQTIQKVCSICSKRVLQTVVVQYDECRCIRRMCRDCDAELEKSGTDSCEIHSLSRRDTRRRRKKTRITWLLIHLHLYTALMYSMCTTLFLPECECGTLTTLVSEATSKPRACFIDHIVHHAATRQSHSNVFAVLVTLTCQMTIKWH